MLTKEEKAKINKEVVGKINEILENHNLSYEMDKLAILNTGEGITFLGNFRIHDEEEVKPIKEELRDFLKSYDKITIKDRYVIPCCELPYTAISFNFKLLNE